MIQIDMDMPKCCSECPLEICDDFDLSHECVLIYKGYTKYVRAGGRLAECPLKGAYDD